MYSFVKQSSSVKGYRYSMWYSTVCEMHIVEKLGKFEMKRPLYFDRENNADGSVYLISNEANLYAFGCNIADAEKDLLEELESAWENYVLCDESELHESGIKYRKWLIGNVEGPSE